MPPAFVKNPPQGGVEQRLGVPFPAVSLVDRCASPPGARKRGTARRLDGLRPWLREEWHVEQAKRSGLQGRRSRRLSGPWRGQGGGGGDPGSRRHVAGGLRGHLRP